MRVVTLSVLCLSLLMATLTGCATNGSSRKVTIDVAVDAIRGSAQAAPQTLTYVLHSGLEGVSENDLRFTEFAKQTENALLLRGYLRVDKIQDANLVIFLAYGISGPSVSTQLFSVPSYDDALLFRMMDPSRRYHYPGYWGPTHRIESVERIRYVRAMTIKAFDAAAFAKLKPPFSRSDLQGLTQLWETNIASLGRDADLRGNFALMLLAGLDFFGSNTERTVEQRFSTLVPDSRLCLIETASLCDQKFPSHWWAKLDRSGAPKWEIFPDEAKEGEVILSKRNELGLLSNFAPTPFEFRGKRYASVEGFWQATKFPEEKSDARRSSKLLWPHTRAEVAQMTAYDAKKAGDQASEIMKKNAIDWVSFENKKLPYREKSRGEFYQLIRQAMRAKLDQNPRVRQVLLSTGDLRLLPDHQQEADAPPAWRYNEIWMEIRTELRQDLKP